MRYPFDLTQNSAISLRYFLFQLKSILTPETFSALLQPLPSELKSTLTETLDPELLTQSITLTIGKPAENVAPKIAELDAIFNFVFADKPNKVQAYAIGNLTACSIFPSDKPAAFQQAAWEKTLLTAFAAIPKSHYHNLPLFADHLDTFFQCHTSLIACPYDKSISFYDFVKTGAAFYLALWQAQAVQNHDKHSEKAPLLLVQGDFFGIQDFIFSGGKDTNKRAAKLLRGRSFQVSLFTELAALKVLQACKLPSCSQMMNAAGKFLIIAPNTEHNREAIEQIQRELNQWFVRHTYGLVGLGIATKTANTEDFAATQFKVLMKGLFEQLEETKLQRLDLTDSTQSVQEIHYPFGVCRLNQCFPADKAYVENDEQSGLSLMSLDQIAIGEQLAKKKRILICDEQADISNTGKTKVLQLPIFGYNIVFTENEEETGKFGDLVRQQRVHRFWDFSIPHSLSAPVWNGYARRYINGYVAKFNEIDPLEQGKYQNVDLSEIRVGEIKPFDFIASEDRKPTEKGNYIGLSALMTLKGDVDNLGTIFQQGLTNANFAKMASLSRQMNQFFSLWLPTYCQQEKLNIYTVFAGGDDFFLIGSWKTTQKVANTMQQKFKTYVAENPKIHFSVGMVITKVGIPVIRLGDLAEEALDKAKNIASGEKNAVHIYQRTVSWKDWAHLVQLEDEIIRLADEYSISVGYLYSLIRLSTQAGNLSQNIENTMWRSHFYYRTARYVADKLPKERREQALNKIIVSLGDKGIEKYQINFAIPLFNYFYSKR